MYTIYNLFFNHFDVNYSCDLVRVIIRLFGDEIELSGDNSTAVNKPKLIYGIEVC
jgi:hypothetical protein